MEPSILQRQFPDGSTFRASDSFVRSWLHRTMSWTRRKATRAAQKLPEDWEDKCEQSAQRKAYLLKEFDIPPALYANSDQTQRLYAPGDRLTYAEQGAKQVSLIGGDEKRAFTVMVTVTSDGTLLPFQAIYQGKTERSCPAPNSPNYKDTIDAGFRFEYSGTKTYWTNQQTMRHFVNHILAPYFNHTKATLGLPPTQRSLWQIDVWSVHRSDEFLDWMSKTHPMILIDFVPGGCTGVAQPCDVGIQRPFKHITNQCFHEDIVDATLKQIDHGELISIDDWLPTLRNASVRWLWKAYQKLNDKAFVKKVSINHPIRQLPHVALCQAFALCTVRDWNLSYESLRSPEMQEALWALKETNPTFWAQLTMTNPRHLRPRQDEIVPEDTIADPLEDEDEDDSDVSLRDVIAETHKEEPTKKARARVANRTKGGLMSSGDAERLDISQNEAELALPEAPKEEGRGKRVKKANKLYGLQDFARHWDDEASDVE
jgi:hypothetical protein